MTQPSPIGPHEINAARSMLDQLLEDSRLYRKGSDNQNLLDFSVRLCNFTPFYALLLPIQKPGLNHAASVRDRCDTFGRAIKHGARPMSILWPLCPSALVFDLMDAEGKPIPVGVTAFATTGAIFQIALARFEQYLSKKNIAWTKFDAGDRNAGSIELVKRPLKPSEPSSYQMAENKSHHSNGQFFKLAHELGYLF